jgi:hypothetical protein
MRLDSLLLIANNAYTQIINGPAIKQSDKILPFLRK